MTDKQIGFLDVNRQPDQSQLPKSVTHTTLKEPEPIFISEREKEIIRAEQEALKKLNELKAK